MANYSVCGIDCDACKFKEQMNCQGCKSNEGKIFWGECALYACANKQNLDHCGQCATFPCDQLQEFASKENPERIENLKKLL